MIVFLGDSFTWGQGLQYIPLVNNKGWTWEECNKIIPPNLNLEWLGFEEDEFRKNNGFPHIVAKKLDMPFVIGRFENGGDNATIYQMIYNLQPFISPHNVFCIVVQFSDASRSLAHEYDPLEGSIERQIEKQVKRINKYCEKLNIPWIGISWQPEIGDILKESYPLNYVPVVIDGVEFTNFSSRYSQLKNLYLTSEYPINDEHLGINGHKIISDLIYNKIVSRKDLMEKYQKYKNEIKTKRK